MAAQAEHEEVMEFIKSYNLMGKGLGYIDVHLIASAILTTGALIWALDRKLDEISSKLDIGFNHSTPLP
jgi:hypothetical protein